METVTFTIEPRLPDDPPEFRLISVEDPQFINALCDAEADININFLHIIAQFTQANFTQVRALLYACLRAGHPRAPITLKECGELMQRDANGCYAALLKALGSKQKDADLPEIQDATEAESQAA